MIGDGGAAARLGGIVWRVMAAARSLILLVCPLLVLQSKGAKVGATVWRQKNYTSTANLGANRVIEKLHTVN